MFNGLRRKKLKAASYGLFFVGIYSLFYQLICALSLNKVLNSNVEDAKGPNTRSVVQRTLHINLNAGTPLICDSNTMTLTVSQINDDYCDCLDGTDESDTSACPNTYFRCKTDKKMIPSGRVNDGICDCCDGSDEWFGTSNLHTNIKDQMLSGVYISPCLVTTC